MAKCRAKAHGYCGIKVREPGEIFEYDGKPAHWFDVIEEAQDEKPESAKAKKGKKSEAGDESKKDDKDDKSVI